MFKTLTHIFGLVLLLAIAIGVGSCEDNPVGPVGPQKPACWKPVPQPSEGAILADKWPVWSRSGKTLAYASEFDSCNDANVGIYLTDSTGIPKDKIEVFGVDFDWLPGDSELILNRGRFFGGKVAKFNLNSGVLTELGINTSSLPLDVSMNGEKLYFDGVNDTIMEFSFRDSSFLNLGIRGGHPAISPDGAKLAYVIGSVNVLDMADGTVQEIAPQGAHPRWTPDGKHIVYHHSLKNEIHLTDMQGNITVLSGGIGKPAVSPDGKYVVFSWSESRVTQLWRVNIDGTGLRQFTR